MKKGLAAAGCLGVILLGVLALIVAMSLGVVSLGASSNSEETQTVGSTCRPDAGIDQVPEEHQDAIADAAAESGLSPAILAAQIEQESGWNPDAVSSAGAQGIAQFMPATWTQWGEGDPTNPADAIAAQGRYMGHLYDDVEPYADNEQNQVELALAAYNAGPGAVAQHEAIPPFAETEGYVQTILGTEQGDYTSDCQPERVGDIGSGDWTHPLPGGQLTSGFGHRGCPSGAQCNAFVTNHHGVDFSTGAATDIVAPTDMQITDTGTNQYQGNYVIAQQLEDPGYIFQFHHCQADSISVSENDEVAVGTPLCVEGETGNAAGAHLHLGINSPEADPTQPTYEHALDPEPLLTAAGVL